MQAGDLVCSKYDLSQGLIDPLGMITNIKEWTRGEKTYTSIYVLLFKSKTIDAFNKDQLVKLEDINYEQGYKSRGQDKT